MRIWIIAAMLSTSGWTATASAQSIEARVDKVERELRAVQRKVFPGGTGLTVEPQITGPAQAPVVAPGTPASGALTDLIERVGALESQISVLTGQTEQNGYRVRQLEEAFAAYKTATDARLSALEGGAAPAPAVGGPATSIDRATPARPSATRPPATRPTAPATARADAARVEAVAAIDRPSSGDAAEDGYLYGYRLWDAKYYPEAQAALKAVADKHPEHRRASYAQNLLGRAYLDEGKPALASVALYDSYQKWPQGERAPDSLVYLGQALTRLKKPADACKVYDELADVYAGKISASLQAQVTRGRTEAKCG